MTNYMVQAEGFEGRQLEVRSSGALGKSQLFVDGVPAPPGPKKNQYLLTRADGRQVVALIKAGFPDPAPVLVVDGRTIKIAPPLQWYEWLWAGVPLLLLAGGALGGALGAVAVTLNAQIFRGTQNIAARYALSALVTILAFVIFAVLAVALQSALPSRPR